MGSSVYYGYLRKGTFFFLNSKAFSVFLPQGYEEKVPSLFLANLFLLSFPLLLRVIALVLGIAR
jgi:hypothetical protein